MLTAGRYAAAQLHDAHPRPQKDGGIIYQKPRISAAPEHGLDGNNVISEDVDVTRAVGTLAGVPRLKFVPIRLCRNK